MDRNAHLDYLELVRRDLAAARDRITELEGELSEVRRRFTDLERVESIVAVFAGAAVQVRGVDQPIDTSDSAAQNPSEPESRAPGIVRHADVVEAILRDSGGAMKVSEIIEAMAARQHPLPQDPHKQFGAIYSAMLRRPQVFEKVDRKWQLIGSGGHHARPDFDSRRPASRNDSAGRRLPS